MSVVTDDIIWNASIKAFRQDIEGRRDRAITSLNGLQNKDGLYASEHRKLCRLYGDVLDVIEKHERRSGTPPAPPNTPSVKGGN
jgi:hypothetical protein